MAMQGDICPICLKTMDAPLITNCGHEFCRCCLSEHLYRNHFLGGGRGMLSNLCPCCRQAVIWCRPPSSPTLLTGAQSKGGELDSVDPVPYPHLDVLLGRVLIEVPVIPKQPILDTVSVAFNVPRASVKLIHRGEVIKEEGKLRALSEKGARVTLLSYRTPSKSAWGLLLLAFFKLKKDLITTMLWVYTAVLSLVSQTCLWFLPTWRAFLQPIYNVCCAFVYSFSPDYRPPERNSC
ncbi:hypothetical protein CEUSTIGMA_g3417.t1 [Chlamydomonas eustigma]|uniref:RING-type domain-containing protein n=1 Tax=Chlamydomonas eustigma TaxID=1157962 RepID=A0A250WYQ1_9CHLO|nr:hypothetical protein CEUSTIGMA_g3417.t1 [Chlamydomonas eustigma]|eukprot:GAX75974.1 hypothetical protein CEUSTIGMA_g3417.t1 [Chlamydomonas eustigma]